MPQDDTRRFSNEEASQIWRRAAELQARRRLPASSDEDGDAADPAEQPPLSSDEVVSIAREAGIEPEFVQQALVEAEFAPAAPEDDAHTLLTRRQIDAPIAAVQTALQEVAQREPFKLRMVDIQPAGDARVLVFDLGPDWGDTLRAGSLASADNAIALHALLRDGATPGSTELVLYGVPNPALPRLVRAHDLGFGGLGGLIGGSLGGVLGVELALGGALLAAPVAAGALGLGAAGAGLLRYLQGRARRKDAESLEKLANEVVGAVRIRRHARRLEPGDGR